MLGCLLIQTGPWPLGQRGSKGCVLGAVEACALPLLHSSSCALSSSGRRHSLPRTEGFLKAGTQHRAGRISLTRSWGCI